MKTQTILLRIRYKDYKALRYKFPAYKFESAASYFSRLNKYLRDLKKSLQEAYNDGFNDN
jgi:hypothetical protein